MKIIVEDLHNASIVQKLDTNHRIVDENEPDRLAAIVLDLALDPVRSIDIITRIIDESTEEMKKINILSELGIIIWRF